MSINRKEFQMSDYPKTGSYTHEELCFAATSRCQCGAGHAYPPADADVAGYWDCSAVLLGTVQPSQDHKTFPFAYYEVKSENQPSAQGATTRPADAPRYVEPPRPAAPEPCPHCGK